MANFKNTSQGKRLSTTLQGVLPDNDVRLEYDQRMHENEDSFSLHKQISLNNFNEIPLGEMDWGDSCYTKVEKDRISRQKENRAYKRDDHFALGTVYLNIPPNQISVSNEYNNFRYDSLRSKGESVFSSGHATTRIDLDIFFNGLDDINNNLRSLLAQIKTIPFLPIENEHIKSLINPFGYESMSVNLRKFKTNQLEKLKRLEEEGGIVRELQELDSRRISNHQKMKKLLDRLESDGYLLNSKYCVLELWEYLKYPKTIMKKDISEDDLNENGDVDPIKFLRKQISYPGYEESNFVSSTKYLNEIADLQKELDHLNSTSSGLLNDSNVQRFSDKQIVGVVSQLAISTVPGYPETLACRLSMYVFNYEPFTSEYSFVSGENYKEWEPDITKCNLFIDWYSKRFLSGDKDGSLSKFNTDENMVFKYVKKLAQTRNKGVNIKSSYADSFTVGKDMAITGITVSFKNIIQFIPILSHKNPTCQYMGSSSSDIQINFEAVKIGENDYSQSLLELTKLVERASDVNRDNNRIAKNAYINIENSFIQFCGLKSVKINSYEVNTVPGNPGLYSVSLSLSEYIKDTENFQKVRREGVVSNKDIKLASHFILKNGREYALGLNQSSREINGYYKKLTNSKNGWLTPQRGAVQAFVFGVGGGLFFARDKIWDSVKERLNTAVKKMNIESNKINISQTSLIGSALPVTMVGAVMFNANYYSKKFSKEFLKAFNDRNSNVGYDNNADLIADIIALVYRSEIIEMILNDVDNSILAGYLLTYRNNKSSPTNKESCYPDLELPMYNELVYGDALKITYSQAGIPCLPQEVDKTPQGDGTFADPDFFMYRGKIWGNLDNNVKFLEARKESIDTFLRLIDGHNRYKYQSSLAEDEFEALLNDTNIGTPEGEDNDVEDNSKNNSKLNDALSGELVKVIRIVDGDTIIIDGELEVRVSGYNAPEENSPGYIEATKALSKLLTHKKVRLYFGEQQKDQYGRLLANVYVKTGKGFEEKNVATEMIAHARELGLKPITFTDNDMSRYYDNKFFEQSEIFIREKKLPKIPGEKFSGQISGNLIAINPTVGIPAHIMTTMMAKRVNSFIHNKGEARASAVITDYLAIAVKECIDIPLDYVKSSLNNPNFGKEFNENISNSISRLFYDKSDTGGYSRFDRMSVEHVKFIDKKIREQQKDDSLRLSRAFPTFRLYFLEEDSPEWGLLDDKYAYDAVISIDVIESRKEAADTAIIRLLNTLGTLDSSQFGNYSESDNYNSRDYKESNKISDQETAQEQNIENFILKPGTRIQLKMGYSSDPDLLDTVFNGMVAEVSAGDEITVIAQGYGVELLQQMNDKPQGVWKNSAFKILDKILNRPDIINLGKWKLFPDLDGSIKVAGRRLVRRNGKFVHPSWWRNIGGIVHFLVLKSDTRISNIYFPEHTFLENIYLGGRQSFIVTKMTIWDVFTEMTNRMPGYITRVLPFDNRGTVFFGPADFSYYFTDRIYTRKQMYEEDYRADINRPAEEKINLLATTLNTKIEKITNVNSNLLMVSRFMSNVYKNYPQSGARRYIECIITRLKNYTFNEDELKSLHKNIENYAIVGTIHALANSLKYILKAPPYLLKDDVNYRAITSGLDLIAWHLENGTYLDRFSVDFNENTKSIDIKYKDFMYKMNDELFTSDQLVARYDRTRDELFDKEYPTKKLVRQYHYKDSFHHIISNNIIASETNMYNKVTVGYGKESYWKKKHLYEQTAAQAYISCQADDDIWAEKIREKRVVEKNARDVITAWMYGLGHLWKGMRDMYTGALTILGDGTVKPYDIVFLSDYYNDMYGPVEVEQVIHHFSKETGFVTNIVPDLLCYVNNIMQEGSVLVANSYRDALGKQLAAYSAFGIKENLAARIVFSMTKMSTSRREPISFTPLLYAGKPYLAGIEGFRKNQWWESLGGRVDRKSRIYTEGFKEFSPVLNNITKQVLTGGS